MAVGSAIRASVRCVQTRLNVSLSSTFPHLSLSIQLLLPLSEPDVVFSSLPVPPAPATIVQLTATIARRLTPQPIKLRADIELTCYTPAGIDAIKKALRSGENMGNETVPIKAKLVAPPLYVLGTNATDKVRFGCVSFLVRMLLIRFVRFYFL